MNVGLASRALGRVGVAPRWPVRALVSGFGSHSRAFTSLPTSEQAKVGELARRVAASYAGRGAPIRTIVLTGHADFDTPRRPKYERAVALARAHEIRAALANAMDLLGGRWDPRPRVWPPLSSRIDWVVRSAGASRPVVASPRSEAERARNRRVAIELAPFKLGSSAQAHTFDGDDFDAGNSDADALDLRPEAQARVDAIIADFVARAPSSASVPYWCVEAVSYMTAHFCRQVRDGGSCCAPQDPSRGCNNRRCPLVVRGPEILESKSYSPPLVGAARVCNDPLEACKLERPCCDPTTTCPGGALSCDRCRNIPGNYMVLKYKPAPLFGAVDRMQKAVDRGCSLPVDVISGICDDNFDRGCQANPRWQLCGEHRVMIIGRIRDLFVFWDSSEQSSICRERATDRSRFYFGLMFYDAIHDRLTTAVDDADLVVNASGMHVGPRRVGDRIPQKRFQATNVFNGSAYR